MEERPYNTPNWVTRWTDVHIITSWAATLSEVSRLSTGIPKDRSGGNYDIQ